jgi:hypothetical protein
MKSLFAIAAAAAVVALAGPVSAQMNPQPRYTAGPMQDNGSSSDYPVPMPGDQSGAALNTQYRNGITTVMPPGVPPPPGFVAVPPSR